MIIYFILLGMLGGLFLISAKVILPKDREPVGWKLPFYKSAYFLSCLGQKKRNRKEEKQIWEQTEKLTDMLLILFLGLGLTLLADGMLGKKGEVQNRFEVERPSNGEGDQILSLQVQIEGTEETADIDITISERQYTDAEKKGFLEQAMAELDTVVLGENTSWDHIQDRIVLPAELLEGKVSVQWSREITPDDAIDEQGVISEDIPPEGVLLQLQGILCCQDHEAVYQRALRLFPPNRNRLEQLLYELEKKVQEKDAGTAEERILALPAEINGKTVIWQEREESLMGLCLVFTLIAAAAAYFGKAQEFQKQEQLRSRQLIMDYPGLLFQLSMLLEAGLTIQNAFCKIALDYRERKADECRFVYEEMLVSCYEMQSGVSERKAYEDFGRRCAENCYVRLGTMLSGGLQKGAQGLTVLLREEAQTAMETRRQLAKKLGEEAGTKLLLPMMLMLLVVLVILMVPAVMSF